MDSPELAISRLIDPTSEQLGLSPRNDAVSVEEPIDPFASFVSCDIRRLRSACHSLEAILKYEGEVYRR